MEERIVQVWALQLQVSELVEATELDVPDIDSCS